MTRATVVLMIGLACAGCALSTAERGASPSAMVRPETPSQQCDREASSLTSPDRTAASAPWSGTPWTEAREWAVATQSDKASLERSLRRHVYERCLESAAGR